MSLWMVALSAYALPPDRLNTLRAIGTGNVERFAVNPSETLIGGRDIGTMDGFVLDLEGWSLHILNDCSVTGVAFVPISDGTTDVWYSCNDGLLRLQNWDPTTSQLSKLFDDEGEELYVDFSYGYDDTTALSSLNGVFAYDAGDGKGTLLYVVQAANNYQGSVSVVDPANFSIDFAYAGYPRVLGYDGFTEGVVTENGWLAITHGQQRLSSVELGPGTQVNVNPIGNQFSCQDMAPGYNPDSVYCLGGLGAFTSLAAPTMAFSVLDIPGDSTKKAVIAQNDDLDSWLAATGAQVEVWRLSNGVVQNPTTPYFSGALDSNNQIQDGIAVDEYLFGGGSNGNLHIVSANPWMRPAELSVEPTGRLLAGDVVTVSFESDSDVDYEVVLNTDRQRNDQGTTIATGSAEANTRVQVEVTVDESFEEGNNYVYVFGTGDRDTTGHARGTIDVDNPPNPPVLTDANVSLSDGGLLLSFPGISDADLSHYLVYYSDEPWVRADYPTDGPSAPEGLDGPLNWSAEPGETVSERISSLNNGTVYYIGVRAVDEGGKVGPMSQVVSGTPEETFTAGDLAGETGGTPCSTGAGALSSSLAVGWALGAAAFVRRRSRWLAPLLLLGSSGAVVGSDAMAADDNRYDDDEEDDTIFRRDLTKARGNFELRYGTINLEDDNITEVYDETVTNMLQLEFGPQFYRFAEMDFGIGFFQEIATKETLGGVNAGDLTMLTWTPLMLDFTLRAHILDEQVLVPYVRGGFDYIIYSEKEDAADGGKETLRGAKFGNHVGAGVSLLLDTFAKGRASQLEAQTGINDSWIVFEWRRQVVDGRARPWQAPLPSGFDFTGAMFTVGLKLDY